MQLSQILSELMDSHNVSAYKIGKDTGISDRLIGYWKKGEKLPSAENLVILATYFGTSVDFLLGRTEQTEDTTRFRVYSTTPEERADNRINQLMETFNKLTDDAQEAVLDYVAFVATQPKNLKNEDIDTELNA